KQTLEFRCVHQIGLANQFVQQLADFSKRSGLANQPINFWMASLVDIFALIAELLEEFLARTQARKLDLDLLIRHTSGQFDEFPRQIEDFDRLAHVEQENFAALALCSALKH